MLDEVYTHLQLLIIEYLDYDGLHRLACAWRKGWPYIDRAGRSLVRQGIEGSESMPNELKLFDKTENMWQLISSAALFDPQDLNRPGPDSSRTYLKLPQDSTVFFYQFECSKTNHIRRFYALNTHEELAIIHDGPQRYELRNVTTILTPRRMQILPAIKRIQLICLIPKCYPLVIYDTGYSFSVGPKRGLSSTFGRLALFTAGEYGLARLYLPNILWPKISFRAVKQYPQSSKHQHFIRRKSAAILEGHTHAVNSLLQISTLASSPCTFTIASEPSNRRFHTDLTTAIQIASETPGMLCMHEIEHKALSTFVQDMTPLSYKYQVAQPFTLLPLSHRPASTCLILGGSGAKSALHKDPFNWMGWHLLLRGSKRWRFYSSEQLKQVGTIRSISAASHSEPSLGSATILDISSTQETLSPFREITQHAGDLLFFPGDCWHQVEHISDDHDQGGTVAVCGQFAHDFKATIDHIAAHLGLTRVAESFAANKLPPRFQVDIFLKLATVQSNIIAV